MDLSNLCEYPDITIALLNEYGADENLREKVQLRHDVKPIRIMTHFIARNDDMAVEKMLEWTRRTIQKYFG